MSSSHRISIELAGTARANSDAPANFAFSPDNRWLSFLSAQDGLHQLFGVNLATRETVQLFTPPTEADTEENLSLEEKLRRERLRQFIQGVTQYSWGMRGDTALLLVPLQGNLYVQEGVPGPVHCVFDKSSTGAAGGALNAKFSPDGRRIAFVQERELCVVDTKPATPGTPNVALQLTRGAREVEGLSNGVADYLAQEEMHRLDGFWWSPCGEWLAFEAVDERHIPPHTIVHQGQLSSGPAPSETHRFPYAGQPNPRVRLGVVAASGGEVTWLEVSEDPEDYLARLHWLPDGALALQVQNRAQTSLALVRVEPRSGRRRALLTEHGAPWLNLHHSFLTHAVPGGGFEFVWASERTGYRHLYHYSVPAGAEEEAQLVGAVTDGEWGVDDVRAVDWERGVVYFQAGRDGPTHRHLYAAPLPKAGSAAGAGDVTRLTPEGGVHDVVVSLRAGAFVDYWSDVRTPPSVTLWVLQPDKRAAASPHVVFDGRRAPLLAPLLADGALPPPRLVTLHAADGVTDLHAALYVPDSAEFGPGPHPTVVNVYGGPGVQYVTDSWMLTGDVRCQRLRQLGYLVIKCDNRGSFRRGVAFEAAIHRAMGGVEVQDQVAAVRWAVRQGMADPERVGVFGWSYGGYMSLMCLAQAPGVFKVAVSGAPVTDWRLYDTHYTERYMSTPQANPEGYARSSVVEMAGKLPAERGRLLIVHGMLDENVLFRNTAALIAAMLEAGRPHDLLVLPDDRHAVRSKGARIAIQSRMEEYFAAALKA